MILWDDPDVPHEPTYLVSPAWAVAGLVVCVAVMAAILGWAAHVIYIGGAMLPLTDWLRLFGVSLALWIVALGAMWVTFR